MLQQQVSDDGMSRRVNDYSSIWIFTKTEDCQLIEEGVNETNLQIKLVFNILLLSWQTGIVLIM